MKYYVNKGVRTSSKVYHTNRDCQNVQQAKHIAETTKELVEARGLHQCLGCKLGPEVAYNNKNFARKKREEIAMTRRERARHFSRGPAVQTLMGTTEWQ